MPEGDTVWNTARILERALVGDVLTGSDFRVPQLANTRLAGWTVVGSGSRGKHLLLRLTRRGEIPRTLHSHLRMDGAWRAYAPGERWSGRPAHLIRVVIRNARSVAVGYHLHEVALIPTTEEDKLVGHLGPDLLGPDWDPAEAARRIAAHPEVTIAEALLDQRNLAGVGNLYKAETLFLRGLWPWTPVAKVADLTGVVELAQKLVAANRGRWTQATTGSLRRGTTTYVYGRRAQPCRRCGTAIEKAPTPDNPPVRTLTVDAPSTGGPGRHGLNRNGPPTTGPTANDPYAGGPTVIASPAKVSLDADRVDRRPIRKAQSEVADQEERVTYWCPRCQPSP